MLTPLVTSAATVALFLHQVTMPPKAQTPDNEPVLTTVQERILFRVCKQAEEDEVERCRARQMRAFTSKTVKSTPTSAYETYDALDLGGNRLRARMHERLLNRVQEEVKTRQTYRENPLQQDSSLQPRTYVDDIRQGRLECMLKRPGRSRSICMDELGNKVRDLMRSHRGSRNYPAE